MCLVGGPQAGPQADRRGLGFPRPDTPERAVRPDTGTGPLDLGQCPSYDRRLLLVWHGYWVAEPFQIKEVLGEMNLDRKVIDTFLLVLPNGEVHWVADPGQLFT